MKKILFIGLLMSLVLLVSLNTTKNGQVIQDLKMQSRFDRWLMENGKNLENENMYSYRLQIFGENLKKIEEHNKAGHSWMMGETPMMIYTQEEFEELFLMRHSFEYENERKSESQTTQLNNNLDSNSAEPVSINWVQKGAIQNFTMPVQCAGSYASSVVSNIESLNFIRTNQTVQYSFQQLIDCSTKQGNQGCNGGYPNNAFQYITEKGIETAQQYPLKGYQGACNQNSSISVKVITDYRSIASNDCAALQQQLATQPIVVEVDATQWQNYKNGTIMEKDCGKTLNLAVSLVGQDVEQSYFIVQNWWGPQWGQGGYIFLELANTCGICKQASTGSL